jgi:hypothetical protein
MTINLSPEEKLAIAEQHMKNVMYTEYNATLNLMEANALSIPNESNIAQLNAQLADVNAQIAIIQKEIDAQNAAIALATSVTPTSN